MQKKFKNLPYPKMYGRGQKKCKLDLDFKIVNFHQ